MNRPTPLPTGQGHLCEVGQDARPARGVTRGHVVLAVWSMRSPMAEPWSLNTLAEEVRLSRSQVVRAFNPTVGPSPMAATSVGHPGKPSVMNPDRARATHDTEPSLAPITSQARSPLPSNGAKGSEHQSIRPSLSPPSHALGTTPTPTSLPSHRDSTSGAPADVSASASYNADS
jgi:hypothetical protein